MHRSLGARVLEWMGWAMATVFGVAGLALAWLAYARAQLPYGETGSYLDGEVVLHAQAVLVFALLALVCLAAAVGALWVARRAHRRGNGG